MWDWIPDRIKRVFLPRKDMFKYLAKKYGLTDKVILCVQYNGHWILYPVVQNAENCDVQLPVDFIVDLRKHILRPERKKRFKDKYHLDPKFRVNSRAITLEEMQGLKAQHASGEVVWAS